MLTRRSLLQQSPALALLARRGLLFGAPATVAAPRLLAPVRRHPPGDPDLQSLATRAIEAARSAGATYADVRLTATREQAFYSQTLVQDSDLRAAGVRVLVNGVWGFLSSALWTPDEMARLAREAVAQAIANAMGHRHEIDFGGVPVATGTWTMPVKYDPFDIPTVEKLDFINDAVAYVGECPEGQAPATELHFRRQHKVFASSEGSAWAQTTYLTSGGFVVGYRDQYSLGLRMGSAFADFLSPAGKGWEHISESGLIDQIPRLIDDAEQSRHQVPVDINVYDTVFSAQAMAALLDATVGTSTELDRALGYEANAGGTSYHSDPLAMLGVEKFGAPLLTVTGDRSTPGGAATVKWDDDGVVPDTIPLVTNGVLTDFQTTREQASWLAPYYTKTNRPIRSHGCAASESALQIAMQQSPNLRLTPGSRATSFDDLVSSVKKGVAVLHLGTEMDQQQLNGVGYPLMRQIMNGKLGPFVSGAGIMFRSTELWKHLTALGGTASERWYGFERFKGEPEQRTTHSVGAVPGIIRDIRVFDATRKA